MRTGRPIRGHRQVHQRFAVGDCVIEKSTYGWDAPDGPATAQGCTVFELDGAIHAPVVLLRGLRSGAARRVPFLLHARPHPVARNCPGRPGSAVKTGGRRALLQWVRLCPTMGHALHRSLTVPVLGVRFDRMLEVVVADVLVASGHALRFLDIPPSAPTARREEQSRGDPRDPATERKTPCPTLDLGRPADAGPIRRGSNRHGVIAVGRLSKPAMKDSSDDGPRAITSSRRRPWC